MKRFEHGKFNITSGKMVCSDPCYPLSLNFGAVEIPALDGEWHVEVVVHLDDMFGRETYYCGMVHIRHSSLDAADLYESHGVGVDSGQFGFFDRSCYPETERERGEFGDQDSFYRKSCDLTIRPARWATLQDRVVVSSGYGDGLYRLVVGYSEGKAVEAYVIFIGDSSDDEEESQD